MFKLKKGWTKEKVMDQVKKFNNGRSAFNPSQSNCVYETEAGNRCAIGCFIPRGHDALYYNGGVSTLLKRYPELRFEMPFDDNQALEEFQKAHDATYNSKVSVYTAIEKFLTDCVE